MDYKLMPGALTIDLVDGSIHGDLDHCPSEDLLESARALLSLLPRVRHKGLWGLSKDYDEGCYIWTTSRHYKAPGELTLEIGWKPHRAFHLGILRGDRASYWKGDWYSKPVGAVIKGGEVVDNIDRVTDHYMPPAMPAAPTPKEKVRAGELRPRVERPRLF